MAVHVLKPGLEPFALLDVLQSIEAKAGRERKIHWGPRTLDLDLLFYDDQILGTKSLIVPHPEIEKRSFCVSADGTDCTMASSSGK